MSDQPTERPLFYCNKCGWFGNQPEHEGCNYAAAQPTEKHEFLERGDLVLCLECGRSQDADVHQPSAVQAPEQATHAKTIANELVAKWLIDNSGFHVGLSDGNTEPDYNDLVVRIADAYEAQAVRIRELEDALTKIANRKTVAAFNTVSEMDQAYQGIVNTARAALKPKEGK